MSRLRSTGVRAEVLGRAFAAGPEPDDDGRERWAVRVTLPLHEEGR